MESEWAHLLSEAIGAEPEGSSMREIANRLGCSLGHTRELIREAIASGRVECNGRRASHRVDGIRTRNCTPVYRLVGKG